MGFIKDHKVIGEQIARATAVRIAGCLRGEKEQGVIYHDQICREQFLTSILIEASSLAPACLRSADMRLAAYLSPDCRVGLEIEIAQRAFGCPDAPLFDSKQLFVVGVA